MNLETIVPIYLDIDDLLLLLICIVLISFVAYLFSHLASSIVNIISGLTKRLKPKFDYSSTKNFDKYIPKFLFKGILKNHGRKLPFRFKR